MQPNKTSSKEREERIKRMENQLIDSMYQKQQYPKKYDYTHTKNPFSVPIQQLDYKSFYQSFALSETNNQANLNKASPLKKSSFQLSYSPNEKEVSINKKQQQQQYRDILQQQIEEKQQKLNKTNTVLDYSDIFSKQQSPNKNSLTKQEYADCLDLQIQEKNYQNTGKKPQPINQSPTQKQTNQENEKKESKEFKMIQMQLKQYQEEKKQQDKKFLLQKKFEEAVAIHEKIKENSVSPTNHGRKHIHEEMDIQDKQRNQDQKNLVHQFLQEQINERQRKKEEEKKQQELEDKMVEEKLKHELEILKEEKRREEEERKERQGKIQQENIKMHQIKLKEKYQRSRSNTFAQNNLAEMEEVIENLEQEVQEEKEQQQKEDIIQTQLHKEQGLPLEKSFTFEDKQNMELEKIKITMINQQKQLERSIHAAMNQAQISLLEGKNKLEKDIILQKNKNNKEFNEDYAISLLNKQATKYRYELPFLFEQKGRHFDDEKYGKQSLISQTNMLPINSQIQQRSYLQGQLEQQKSREKSRSIMKSNYYTQLLDIKQSQNDDNLTNLLLSYNK